MATKFDEFRDAYILYVDEYNSYKLYPKISRELSGLPENDPVDMSEFINRLAVLSASSGILAKQLLAQIQDIFPNQNDKTAYLKSIKGFILREFEMWEHCEPEQRYPWQELYPEEDRIYREWMPDYLFDILHKVNWLEREAKMVASKDAINNDPSQENTGKRQQTKPQIFDSLQEIFIDQRDYKNSIEALRTAKIVDTENRYLLGVREKCAFAYWLFIIDKERNFIRDVTRENICDLLNNEFPTLGLARNSGTIYNTRSHKNLGTRLRGAFSAIYDLES